MPHRRFEDLRDTLNRTLNATISRSRLLVVRAMPDSDRDVITHLIQVRRHVFSSGLLTNGLYLTVRLEVRHVNGIVTVERSSIAYRRSEAPTSATGSSATSTSRARLAEAAIAARRPIVT